MIAGHWRSARKKNTSFLPPGFKYQEVVDNLQEQLSICLREKDHVDNLLQESLAECDRLAALSDRGLQPLVDDLELQCSRKIESYGRSIAALNTEVNRGKLQLNEKQQRVCKSFFQGGGVIFIGNDQLINQLICAALSTLLIWINLNPYQSIK